MQMFAANGLAVIVIGRLIAGFGVGFVSAIIILCESLISYYSSIATRLTILASPTDMSEICPRKVRGALVSGYQFCITIGIMLASIVVNFTSDREDSGAYRIPIGIQVSLSCSPAQL